MKQIFLKEYSAEDLIDLDQDMSEMLNESYNPAMVGIPQDDMGFHEGKFVVSVKWFPHEDS